MAKIHECPVHMLLYCEYSMVLFGGQKHLIILFVRCFKVPVYLQTLYKAPESNNHLTYMSLITILILSEDDLFNQVSASLYDFLNPF